MAAGKTSRPRSNMLVGLDNISGKKSHNFIEINEKEDTARHIADTEPEISGNMNPIDSEPVTLSISDSLPEKNIINEVSETDSVKTVEDKPKRKPGRPRKFAKDEHTSVIGVRLLESEIKFLEEYGWKYGGKTGYVTHLIREEMARINIEKRLY